MVPRVGEYGPAVASRRSDRRTPKSKYRSPSPSSEADDEESLYDPPTTADGEDDMDRVSPRYPGEDVRLTSRKELAGWYSYGWAAEVFIICGIGSFVPITLEQLARERGVLLSDKTTPCGLSFDPTTSDVGGRSSLAPRGPSSAASAQCIIYFLGWEMNTASFAMYTFSLSVLVQALLIISISGAADHGRYRKTFLLVSAVVGALAAMSFLAVVPQVYLLGALLAIISNVCIGTSFVLLNSFIPLLVRYHPSVRRSSPANRFDFASGSASDFDGDSAAEPLTDSTAALLTGAATMKTPSLDSSSRGASPELQLSTEISSYGIGVGYIAGLVVQSLCVVIIVVTGSSLFSLRLVLFTIGAWWLVFTIPAALWLRPRPGPPLGEGRAGNGARRTWVGYIAYAWRKLGKTIMRARQLRDVVLFLSAWFMLSDAIATVSGTAVLFAKTQLQMKPAALASINVIATICGVVGAFSWSKLSRLISLRPSQTVLACICLFELIPLYGLLGYIPAIKRLGVIGLQQPWEMYPLAGVYGFVLGGLSSYCRSLFGELIPAGSEAAFYALYAITDKGSSVFGPAIVGLITDRAGDIRPAFFFLAALIGLPAPLMWAVDVERGKRDGARLLRELGHTTDPNPDIDTEHQED